MIPATSRLLAALTFAAQAALAAPATCGLLGPAYPPATHGLSNPAYAAAAEAFKAELDAIVQTGNSSLLGAMYTANVTWSIAVFSSSSSSDDFLFEHYHEAPDLKGSLTAGDGSLDKDTLWRIGSVTKLVTVYAFLIGAGWEYFDEPVAKYVPELAKKGGIGAGGVDWNRITLGSLAGQLSGLARDYVLGAWDTLPEIEQILGPLPKEDVLTCGRPDLPKCSRNDALTKIFKERPMTTGPYQRALYSNEAFEILAYAYESITGGSFEDGLKKDMFEPLGMDRSFLHPPPADDRNLLRPVPPDVDDTLWDLGALAPAGNVFMSTSDLSKMGTSILRSTLLPQNTTSAWLLPNAHTAHPLKSVGKPWEIFRLDSVPVSAGSHTTRAVDLYTKGGDVSVYHAVLGLSPAHGLGFAVLAADKARIIAPGVHTLLTELVVRTWIPAAEEAARAEAKDGFAGTYSLGESNSTARFDLVDDRQGIAVTQLVYNGVDLLAALGQGLGYVAADLHFFGEGGEVDGDGDGKKRRTKRYEFRAVFQNEEPEDPLWRKEKLMTIHECDVYWNWASIGGLTYGNVGLDEFVFHVDEQGVVSFEMPALRAGLWGKL